MPLIKTIDVLTPDVFEARLTEGLALAKKAEAKLLVLITSDADDEGVKWCGDCAEADPVVEEVLAAAEETVVMVRAFCKRSEYSLSVDPKNADYLFRKDPRLCIVAIPTLIAWGADGPTGQRLVEGQCKSADHVKLLLEDE